jgi:DNA polymerase
MIHLDFETTSACDIGLGHYRYAADPSTRILLFAVSDGGPPLIWRFDEPSEEAKQMLDAAIKRGALIYAHNAPFEMAVSHYRMREDVGIDPPAIEQWRCTKVMALRAAIPASLAGAAEFLKLTDKDKAGKALINIFSDQTKITTLSRGAERLKVMSPILHNPIPWDWQVTVAGEHITVREAWNRFIEYCRKDVVVEQEIHAKLARFELSGFELDGFQFDLRMNHRGIPINRPALTHAQDIIDEQESLLVDEFKSLTGLMPSQTAKVLEWLRFNGYAGEDLKAESMEQQLGSSFLTPEGERALKIRSLLSFAAVKKVSSMLETACPDDMMRGLFQFNGAQKTRRWTASGPQPQNARKPSIRFPDDAYASICSGMSREDILCFHGDIHETVASVVRNFMQPHGGKRMLSLDLSNIESRIGALLAECYWKLDMFRDGTDTYKLLATKVFGTPYDQVTKNQRFVGKVGELSLIFQTGAQKFWETCAAWGQPIERDLAAKTVRTFRQEQNEYPSTWKSYEQAMVSAVKNPGQWFPATQWVKFARTLKEPFDRLIMRLPSGGEIIYPMPQIRTVTKKHKDFETGETREFEGIEFTFYGSNQKTRQWGRQATYAGSVYQSSVQGTARDVMLHGCLQAQQKGFDIWALIHDEALADDGDIDEFHKAFTTVPAWLPQDFPLAAESGRQEYYKKD